MRFAMRTRTTEKEKENVGVSNNILPLASSSSLTTAEISNFSSTSILPPQHYHHAHHNNSHDDNDKKIKNTAAAQNSHDNNKKNITTSTNNTPISRMGLLVLILLAVQNCSKNLIVRHVMAQQQQQHAQFLTSAAVLSSECLKLLCSVLYILLVQQQSWRSIVHYMRRNAQHSMLLCVPACAYNLQMSLEYVALANLNAAMFSVLVQTKLLCTALFAWLVLRKRIKKIQIVSLVLLTTGVMLCNMQNNDSSSSSANNKTTTTTEEEEERRQTKGIFATLGIALSSGFASVYTEKFIKGAPQTSQQQQQQQASLSSSSLPATSRDKILLDPAAELEASLRGHHAVIMNDDDDDDDDKNSETTSSYGLAYTQIQLAVMSIVTIGLYAAMMDWHDIVTHGLFFNFSHGAVVSVVMSALGGLIVASVLKHADSILKGYATALSVILTGILSRILFDTQLSAIYFMGIINVVIAVILYNGQDLYQYIC